MGCRAEHRTSVSFNRGFPRFLRRLFFFAFGYVSPPATTRLSVFRFFKSNQQPDFENGRRLQLYCSASEVLSTECGYPSFQFWCRDPTVGGYICVGILDDVLTTRNTLTTQNNGLTAWNILTTRNKVLTTWNTDPMRREYSGFISLRDTNINQ